MLEGLAAVQCLHKRLMNPFRDDRANIAVCRRLIEDYKGVACEN